MNITIYRTTLIKNAWDPENGSDKKILSAVHPSPQPTAPLRQHEISLQGQWFKMGSMQPWAPLQGSEAFQWGGNKVGLRGEIKRTPHLHFLHAVITQHGMLSTVRGEGRSEN